MTVYLVGAGPGDPGLLTVRGAELLANADVVVYDRLSVSTLLDLAPAGAERVSVGKAPGHATLPQDEINMLLVERGKLGQRVVRLKGGDPFVFARGGEEAEALQAAGVPFEVVPGISSAVAVPAYAGIPLTMRHSSTLFTVITGHEDPGKDGELDWETVAKLGGTIVVLMGIGRLPKIVKRLLTGGLDAATPVAAVQWGTRPEQRTVRATLATITDHELAPPATIVIGRVAAMNFEWFESKPLFGRRVVVTRTREQASQLSMALRAQGAEPLELPVIEVQPPPDGGAALRDAATRLPAGAYEWLVLTSPNGATRLLGELRDARDLGGVRVAAIGPGTADRLRAFHIEADLVPPEAVAESLVAAFPDVDDGGRVLMARAVVARDVLPAGLRAKGWEVDVVDAYETVPVKLTAEQREVLGTADVVTFTSSSTVTNFVAAAGAGRVPPIVACIGPVTAATARAEGLKVDVEAITHTIPGLVDALVEHLRLP
ncbi:MAG: uroporphyrinogen-III C-methyltransferase [Actinobacteria bacterium]|nr:uroporphyrinogen-III C-methyltransferase [Actinomycetota bacterium]